MSFESRYGMWAVEVVGSVSLPMTVPRVRRLCMRCQLS